MDSIPLLTLLVAVAGPIGITLGWWLGRRSERERERRDERKSAYVDFARAISAWRTTEMTGRPAIRNERWERMTVLLLVAPPDVFQEAWAAATAGERLADELDDAELEAVHRGIWEHWSRFVSLARADLGVGEDPFGKYRPTHARSGPPMMEAADEIAPASGIKIAS